MAIEPQEHQFKELEKFTMFTEAPGVQGRRARLQWSSYRGNPRITVFTGVPEDTHKGVIIAAMNPETFTILMNFVENVTRGPAGRHLHIENYTIPRQEEGEKKNYDKILSSKTYVGKDENGMIWISVRAENRPTIVFKFQVSDFHKLFNEKNEPFTAEEASVLQARAVMKSLDRILGEHASLLRPPYDPEAAKAKQSGQGNKTYQKKETKVELDDVMF